MPTVVAIRLRHSYKDLWFDPGLHKIDLLDNVIVSTARGTEIGVCMRTAFEVDESELRSELKPVLRIATGEDLERAEELDAAAQEALDIFKGLVAKHDLPMRPISCEYVFGKERAIFHFSSEERVDFRALVRDLASHFGMRVELHQIGVRDEAAMIGGFAPCGQELCCKRFGGDFEPVSIRMAKDQDLALNPTKISGMCGRLMCCLRYEVGAYKDFKQRAPQRGAKIDTPLGEASVSDLHTPREEVTLRFENGKQFAVPLSKMCCCSKGGGCCATRERERPNCITREALEEIDSTSIRLALADLDQESTKSSYEEAVQSDYPARTRAERIGSVRREERSRGQERMTEDLHADVDASASPEHDEGKRHKRERRQRESSRKGMQPTRHKHKGRKGDDQSRQRVEKSSETEQKAHAQSVRRRRRPGDQGGSPAQKQVNAARQDRARTSHVSHATTAPERAAGAAGASAGRRRRRRSTE